MKINEIKKYVKENYKALPESIFKQDGKLVATGVAIWGRDDSGSYETDVEVILVTESGKLLWVFASGCSCYTDVEVEKIAARSIKSFKLKWKTIPVITLIEDFWKDGVPKIESYEEDGYE